MTQATAIESELVRDIKDLKSDIKTLRLVMNDNTFKLGEYNAQLTIHIQGTKDLQTRIIPLEDHLKFLRTLAKWVSWGMAFGASFASFMHYIVGFKL